MHLQLCANAVCRDFNFHCPITPCRDETRPRSNDQQPAQSRSCTMICFYKKQLGDIAHTRVLRYNQKSLCLPNGCLPNVTIHYNGLKVMHAGCVPHVP
jgi:hypothetical protein